MAENTSAGCFGPPAPPAASAAAALTAAAAEAEAAPVAAAGRVCRCPLVWPTGQTGWPWMAATRCCWRLMGLMGPAQTPTFQVGGGWSGLSVGVGVGGMQGPGMAVRCARINLLRAADCWSFPGQQPVRPTAEQHCALLLAAAAGTRLSLLDRGFIYAVAHVRWVCKWGISKCGVLQLISFCKPAWQRSVTQ